MELGFKKSRDFFSHIVYSSSNEDGRSELTALNLSKTDHVLAVTGSGSRVLDLLLSDAQTVTAIDFNSNQNFLLALKICALKYLSDDDFLKFIGLTKSDSKTRLNLYQKISEYLPSDQKLYWDRNIKLIKHGILFCGTWEKYLYFLSKFLFFKKKTLHKLWSAKTLQEQSQIWNTEWKGFFWKLALKTVSQRFIWKYILREPGIDCVSKEFSIFEYMNQCFERFIQTQFLRDSFFAQMIFYGKLSSDGALPLYLQKHNFSVIRSRLNRINIVHADLNLFLNDPKNKNQFDAFSLSDFSSYASEEIYQKIWGGVLNAARDGARICERQFLVKRDPAIITENILKRKVFLEKNLQNNDSALIYSFVCGSKEIIE